MKWDHAWQSARRHAAVGMFGHASELMVSVIGDAALPDYLIPFAQSALGEYRRLAQPTPLQRFSKWLDDRKQRKAAA